MDPAVVKWLMVGEGDLELEHLAFPPWYEYAACRDEDTATFYPRRGENRWRDAVAICRRCLVARECLNQALEDEGPDAPKSSRGGVWGGMTASQRVTFARMTRKPDLPWRVPGVRLYEPEP